MQGLEIISLHSIVTVLFLRNAVYYSQTIQIAIFSDTLSFIAISTISTNTITLFVDTYQMSDTALNDKHMLSS